MEQQESKKPKKGAKKGNRNALKHGFYSGMFAEMERLDFNNASGMEGIDEEIALLRLEIKKAISGGDERNLLLLVKASNALEKLIRTRYQITSAQRKGLREAVQNVIKDVLIPLGLNVGGAALVKKVT
jgi:hypothetical protein